MITIVSSRTFARWASDQTKSVDKKTESSKGGRPRKPEDVPALAIQMAKENGWGLGRMMGELQRLGLAISTGTIRNILRNTASTWACAAAKALALGSEDPRLIRFPRRRSGPWRAGRVLRTVLHLAGCAEGPFSWHLDQPDAASMMQQARNLRTFFGDQSEPVKYIICDRDTKSTQIFGEMLESNGPHCSLALDFRCATWRDAGRVATKFAMAEHETTVVQRLPGGSTRRQSALPLYRQEDFFARHGLHIPRSTQCDWVRAAAEF